MEAFESNRVLPSTEANGVGCSLPQKLGATLGRPDLKECQNESNSDLLARVPVVSPWIRWIDTAPWRVVDSAIRHLESNGEMLTIADRDIVVGTICCYLDGELLLRESRFSRVCRVFDGYEETELPGGDLKGIALEACGVMDNGGGELELSHYLARYQDEVPTPEVGWRIDLAALAKRLLEAYQAPID